MEHNLKRRFRKFLLDNAYLDRERAETTNRLSEQEVLRHLLAKFEYVPVSFVADLECGEVLLDSRGLGSLQRR